MLDGQQLMFDPHLVGESYAYGLIHVRGWVWPGWQGGRSHGTASDNARQVSSHTPDSEHMAPGAELVGILLGIHLI
jgi:hypothetical protein